MLFPKDSRVRVKDVALDNINEEPHPMRGMIGTLVDVFPMTPEGVNCKVIYDCFHAEAAERHHVHIDDWMEMINNDPAWERNGHPILEEDMDNLEILS